METIKCLPEIDQEMAMMYIISGVFFLVFSYLIYYCRFIMNSIRYSTAILMFSIGFMFMSTAGNIIKGHEYSLRILTQWSIIVCTSIAFWVVLELIKWNKKKQKENETDLSTDN